MEPLQEKSQKNSVNNEQIQGPQPGEMSKIQLYNQNSLSDTSKPFELQNNYIDLEEMDFDIQKPFSSPIGFLLTRPQCQKADVRVDQKIQVSKENLNIYQTQAQNNQSLSISIAKSLENIIQEENTEPLQNQIATENKIAEVQIESEKQPFQLEQQPNSILNKENLSLRQPTYDKGEQIAVDPKSQLHNGENMESEHTNRQMVDEQQQFIINQEKNMIYNQVPIIQELPIIQEVSIDHQNRACIPEYLLQNQSDCRFQREIQPQRIIQSLHTHLLVDQNQALAPISEKFQNNFKIIGQSNKIQNKIKEEIGSNSNLKSKFQFLEAKQGYEIDLFLKNDNSFKKDAPLKKGFEKRQSLNDNDSQSQSFTQLNQLMKRTDKSQDILLKQFKNEHYEIRDKYFEHESEIYKKYILNMQKTLQKQYEKCKSKEIQSLNNFGNSWAYQNRKVSEICEINENQFLIYLKNQLLTKSSQLPKLKEQSNPEFQQLDTKYAYQRLNPFKGQKQEQIQSYETKLKYKNTPSQFILTKQKQQYEKEKYMLLPNQQNKQFKYDFSMSKQLLLEFDTYKNEKLESNSAKFRAYLRNIMIHMSNYVDMTDKVEQLFIMNYKQLMAYYSSIVGPRNIVRYETFLYEKPQTPYDDNPYGLNGIQNQQELSENETYRDLMSRKDSYHNNEEQMDKQSFQESENATNKNRQIESQNHFNCPSNQMTLNQLSSLKNMIQGNTYKNEQIQPFQQNQVNRTAVQKQNQVCINLQQQHMNNPKMQDMNTSSQNQGQKSQAYIDERTISLDQIAEKINQMINQDEATPMFGLKDVTFCEDRQETQPQMHFISSSQVSNIPIQQDPKQQTQQQNLPQSIICEQSVSEQDIFCQQNLQKYSQSDLKAILKCYLSAQQSQSEQQIQNYSHQELKHFIRSHIAAESSKRKEIIELDMSQSQSEPQDIQRSVQGQNLTSTGMKNQETHVISQNSQPHAALPQKIQQQSPHQTGQKNFGEKISPNEVISVNINTPIHQQIINTDIYIQSTQNQIQVEPSEQNNLQSQNGIQNQRQGEISNQSQNVNLNQNKSPQPIPAAVTNDKISTVMGSFKQKVEKQIIDILSDDSEQSIQVPVLNDTLKTVQNQEQLQSLRGNQQKSSNINIIEQKNQKNPIIADEEANDQKKDSGEASNIGQVAQSLRKGFIAINPQFADILKAVDDQQILQLWKNYQQNVSSQQRPTNQNRNQNQPAEKTNPNQKDNMQIEQNQESNQQQDRVDNGQKDPVTLEQFDLMIKAVIQMNPGLEEQIKTMSREQLLDVYCEGIKENRKINEKNSKNNRKNKNHAQVIDLESQSGHSPQSNQKLNITPPSNQTFQHAQTNSLTSKTIQQQSSLRSLPLRPPSAQAYFSQIVKKMQTQNKRQQKEGNTWFKSSNKSIKIHKQLLLAFLQSRDYNKKIQSLYKAKSNPKLRDQIAKQFALIYARQMIKNNINHSGLETFAKCESNKNFNNKQFFYTTSKIKPQDITNPEIRKYINRDFHITIERPKMTEQRKQMILQLKRDQMNESQSRANHYSGANNQKSLNQDIHPIRKDQAPTIRKRYWMMVEQEMIDPRQSSRLEEEIALQSKKKHVKRSAQIQTDNSKVLKMAKHFVKTIEGSIEEE